MTNLNLIKEKFNTLSDSAKELLIGLTVLILYLITAIIGLPIGLFCYAFLHYYNHTINKRFKSFVDKLELEKFTYSNHFYENAGKIISVNNTDYKLTLRRVEHDRVYLVEENVYQDNLINSVSKHYGFFQSFLMQSNLKEKILFEQLELINKEFLNKTILTNYFFCTIEFDKTKSKPLYLKFKYYSVIFSFTFAYCINIAQYIYNLCLRLKDWNRARKYKKYKASHESR